MPAGQAGQWEPWQGEPKTWVECIDYEGQFRITECKKNNVRISQMVRHYKTKRKGLIAWLSPEPTEGKMLVYFADKNEHELRYIEAFQIVDKIEGCEHWVEGSVYRPIIGPLVRYDAPY